MKTIICTTGTSIAVNAKINIDRLKGKTEEHVSKTEKDSIKKAIFNNVRPLFKNIDDFKNISAEIKSLIKIKLEKGDRIILLSSDTVDGFACAEIIKDIIVEQFGCEVFLKRTEGLQANNALLFRKKGLKNLFNELFSLLEGHQYEDIILNPTGGFKSIVPYITIFGMLFNKPVKYIHEESDDLITLVNIPLVIDEYLMFKIEEKLKKIEAEGAITIEEWQSGIEYYDSKYESLIEEDGRFITLSAIGIILYEKFKKDYPDDLERDFTEPEKKKNKLISQKSGHHGNERLISIALRLIKSPYVREILGSCDHQPEYRTYITPLTEIQAKKHLQHEESGICIVTDISTDRGVSFLMKTTAKNYSENVRIAKLLINKFFS